ncbi:MAG: hypothetical protein SGILL_009494 [Bacillariaceae sp.]
MTFISDCIDNTLSNSPLDPHNPVEILKVRKEQLVAKKHQVESDNEKERSSPFPHKISKMFLDFATTPREDFNEKLEIGVPMDNTIPGADDVLLLYTNPASLPNEFGLSHNKQSIDPDTAMENCHTVKVILQQPTSKHQKSNQCIAIVPQWESFVVHKFMRTPPGDRTPVDLEQPLRYMPRSQRDDGLIAEGVPTVKRHANPSYKSLVEYLQNYDRVMETLKPIFQSVMKNIAKATGSTASARTLTVLTCNKGQSMLFRNFVCNAKAKGLDLSSVVMFATDEYTYKLSQDLGIPAFYDEAIFGDMPESAANKYGDMVFARMMMAKVYCVHLALTSGYNVLFQDVDVVWFQNPLQYLESEKFAEYDMIFQDDGSRQVRFAPYSPNSGFYYVRKSDVTMHFFGMFLRMGDAVLKTKSHQEVMTSLINEFSTAYGLRVKVVRKGNDNDIPGGAEFHNNKEYMKELVTGKRKPFVFHMSWTENKENKKKYYEQLGEWYSLEDVDACNGLDCCLAQPNITCHYKDKPSKIPCHNSPTVVEGKGKSFW